MNNWIPKSSILRFAIITASLCIALYFAGLLIVSSEIRKKENLYRDTNSELFKEEKFWAIKSTAETNGEPIQILRDFLVRAGDDIQFIETIEDTARNASIKFEIASIEVETNPDDTFKESINIKMKTESSWKNTLRFLDNLKKIPFGVSIAKVDLDAGSSGTWAGSVEFTIFRER